LCEECKRLKAEGKIEKAKQSKYGYPGEDGENGKATRCGEHKLLGMENVRSAKCEACLEEVKTGEREKATVANFRYPEENGQLAKQIVLGVFDTAEEANAFEKEVQKLTEEKLAPPKTVDPGHRPPAHRIMRHIGRGGTSAPVNVPDAVERTCVQYVVAMFILPDGLPRGLGFLDGDMDFNLQSSTLHSQQRHK